MRYGGAPSSSLLVWLRRYPMRLKRLSLSFWRRGLYRLPDGLCFVALRLRFRCFRLARLSLRVRELRSFEHRLPPVRLSRRWLDLGFRVALAALAGVSVLLRGVGVPFTGMLLQSLTLWAPASAFSQFGLASGLGFGSSSSATSSTEFLTTIARRS